MKTDKPGLRRLIILGWDRLEREDSWVPKGHNFGNRICFFETEPHGDDFVILPDGTWRPAEHTRPIYEKWLKAAQIRTDRAEEYLTICQVVVDPEVPVNKRIKAGRAADQLFYRVMSLPERLYAYEKARKLGLKTHADFRISGDDNHRRQI